MTGAIGDIGDLVGVALTVAARAQLVQDAANRRHDVDVLALCVAADVVGLTRAALFKNSLKRASVIVHEQPVPHITPVAIDGQGLAVQGANDDQRDQLFGEVIGAIVVGAVGHQHRQAVGVPPGAHQMVRARLRCGVG
ncbi:hypothetical protein D3C86_1546370 [compost metagenome]